MTLQGWLQIGLTLLLGFLVSIPVGGYLARVVTDQKTLLDGMLDPLDNFIYLLIGRGSAARRWTGNLIRCICWRRI
jgi:potassium-transporting ATPase potassium-binding subunit